MTYQVYTARMAELPSVLAIEEECFDENSIWSHAGFEASIAMEDILFLVARTEDEDVAGFVVATCDRDSEYCELLNVAVRSKDRNLGIGTKLLESLFTQAHGRGCNFAKAKLSESAVAACCLLRKMGMTVETTLKADFIRGDGEYDDCYWFTGFTNPSDRQQD